MFSPTSGKQDEHDQVSDGIEIIINLKIEKTLTESPIDNYVVRKTD